MTPSMALFEGLREVRSHGFRSALTVTGVALGVASLMATFAVTAGMVSGMREALQALGGLEQVRVRNRPAPESQALIKDRSPGLTVLDAASIKAHAPLVSWVSPEVNAWGDAIAGANREGGPLLGVWPEYLAANKLTLEAGRFLTPLDEAARNPVCVLPRALGEKLWPDATNGFLGRRVEFNNHTFSVVGVLPRFETDTARRKREAGFTAAQEAAQKQRATVSRTWDPFWFKNRAILVPISTFMSRYRAANLVNGADEGPNPKLDRLVLRVADTGRFAEAMDQVRDRLIQTHRGVNDFGLDTFESWNEGAQRGAWAARASGLLIAGISMLIGGMGITNIMLAGIAERVREIGIRRALGAPASSVFTQVLGEALVLGIIGGVAGVATGFALVGAMDWISPPESVPILEPHAVAISFSAAVLTGALAGLYPGWRAASLSPIEALRYG